jgi:hypothetical protein
LASPKLLDVAASGRPAQRRQQGNEQEFGQIVLRILRSRVGQIPKTLVEPVHRRFLANQETPSESTFLGGTSNSRHPYSIPYHPLRGRAPDMVQASHVDNRQRY